MKGQIPKVRRQAGLTLIETLVSAMVSVLALGTASAVILSGSSTWVLGQGKIQAEQSAEAGVRIIAQELRGAMSVTVDANGLGITYQLPATDANGNYLSPVTWDGVTRRIAYSNGNLVKTVGSNSRTIVSNVILTDPLSSGGTGSYKIFTPGVGVLTRSLTMEIVTSRPGVDSHLVNARNRETIYIRNVPQLVH